MQEINNKENILLHILLIIICFFGISSSFVFPVINLSPTNIGIIILILFIFYILKETKGKIKIDSISIILFIRFIYYTFIVLLNSYDKYLSQYFAICLGLLSYLLIINSTINNKSFVHFAKKLILITGVQASICVFVSLKNNVPLYMLKSTIVTPLGASNLLTVFWLFLLPFVYYDNDSRNFLKNIYLFITGIFILLSRSNSGTLMFAFLILIILLVNKNNGNKKYIIICFIIIMFVFSLINFSGYFDRLSTSMKNIISGDKNSIDSTLNGRDYLYKVDKYLISKKPLFGYGFKYRELTPQNMMAHNWIYESLLSGGIISLLLQLLAMIIVFFSTYKSKSKNVCVAFYIACIITFIQGLFEPSFGSMYFDIIFWIAVGIYIKESKIVKSEIEL